VGSAVADIGCHRDDRRRTRDAGADRDDDVLVGSILGGNWIGVGDRRNGERLAPRSDVGWQCAAREHRTRVDGHDSHVRHRIDRFVVDIRHTGRDARRAAVRQHVGRAFRDLGHGHPDHAVVAGIGLTDRHAHNRGFGNVAVRQHDAKFVHNDGRRPGNAVRRPRGGRV